MRTPPDRQAPRERPPLLLGLRAGLPIALGYFPIAVTFGVVARAAGLRAVEAAGMSAFVFAGASQFMGVQMLAAAASPATVVAATLLLNLRHLLMSASLSQRLRPGRLASFLVGFGVTDETWVVAALEQRLSVPLFLGLAAEAWTAWLAGTVVGAVAAPIVPPLLARSMGMALYAMFIALLVPAVRGSWQRGVVAALGAAVAWSLARLAPSLGAGWRIVAAMVAAAAVGAVLPEERS